MGKLKKFIYEVIIETRDNDLISMANALSYKLLLAVFPMIIFLMTLVAFFNIDTKNIVGSLTQDMPSDVMNIINVFIKEVVNTKRISLLSTSLFVSLFSASSGFNSLIKGLNKAYNITLDAKGIVKRRFISLVLVVVFCSLIIASLYTLIFSDLINNALIEAGLIRFVPSVLYNVRGYIVNAFIMLGMIIVIYKMSIGKKTPTKELLPGAIFTIISWLIISKGYNIYINNFSKYSVVYGSIGGIFIFAIWINLISYVLLIGGQINAVIYERRGKNGR